MTDTRPATLDRSQQQIADTCDEIKALLLEKNANYGDSALYPCRIMSKASTVEQILVRIDDKLNRIKQGAGLLANDEDVVKDIAGYYILLMIALRNQTNVPIGALRKVEPVGTTGPTHYQGSSLPTPGKLPEDNLPYFVDN